MKGHFYNRFFRFRKNYLFLILLLIFLGGTISAYFEGQLFLILYKLCLCLVAGIIASNLDYALFPFAKPESYLDGKWYEDLEEGVENEADVPIVPGQELAFLVKNQISALKFIEISGVSKTCIFNFINNKTEKLQTVTEGKILAAMQKIEKGVL